MSDTEYSNLIDDEFTQKAKTSLLVVMISLAGLFGAFAWSTEPTFGPTFLDSKLVQGTTVLMTSLFLMDLSSDMKD